MLAGLIRGRHKIAFALTERTHGGDLLANEFEAREEDGRASDLGREMADWQRHACDRDYAAGANQAGGWPPRLLVPVRR